MVTVHLRCWNTQVNCPKGKFQRGFTACLIAWGQMSRITGPEPAAMVSDNVFSNEPDYISPAKVRVIFFLCLHFISIDRIYVQIFERAPGTDIQLTHNYQIIITDTFGFNIIKPYKTKTKLINQITIFKIKPHNKKQTNKQKEKVYYDR